jgi:hypothetical protein
MSVLRIKNGSSWHDYSNMVQLSGVGWKRNDLDADGSGRTLDGRMHRAKITDKRTMDYTLMPDRQSRYAALDTDLSQEEFEAQYEDLHGLMTKTFYCSSFSATMDQYGENGAEWSGGSFTLIEV